MIRLLPIALILTACGKEEAKDGPLEEPLPEVWGLTPLPDLDPAPGVVEVEMVASPARAPYLDEGGRTQVWSYDDQVPGPLIQARVGDLVKIHFKNKLPDETTIHWHGLRIPDEMDGVPAVQDPIQPGDSFTYEFVVPDAGSYWYHPHVRSHEQIERGLYGALVVHEAEPPAYDAERYFVLDDVLLDDANQVDDPGEILGMDAMHGRHGNVLLANGSGELLETEIQRGTRERWRIVNTANARTMWVTVTGADWRVIAIDGTLLPEPIRGRERERLPVGRRLDLEVVPGASAAAAKLHVELPASTTTFDRYPIFEGSLVGEGGSAGFLDWSAPDLPALAEPVQEVDIELNAQSTMSSLQWTINGAVYGEGDFIQVKGNRPTRIQIRELSGAEHPFHLHGQFFQIVDRDTDEVLPGLLDTMLMAPLETATIQTDFDNPGTWMAHCHILEHAELGMMTELHVSE